MADNQFGSYYLSDRKDLYEIQRENNFEFVVSDIDSLLRAGAMGNEENAYITNGQEVLRFSMVGAFLPTFSQEPIVIRRGNSVMKAAGIPTFKDGQITVNDYIGADTKSVLMAWQALSYNVKTEKVGRMSDYKKDCTLIEYTPDYTQIVRTWKLIGCWVQDIDGGQYTMESGGKKTITATIVYDTAYIDYDGLE